MLFGFFILHRGLPCQEIGVTVWPSAALHQCVHSPFCMRVCENGCQGDDVQGLCTATPTAREHAQPKLSSLALPSLGLTLQSSPDQRTSYNRPLSDLGHQRTSRWEISQVCPRPIMGMRPRKIRVREVRAVHILEISFQRVHNKSSVEGGQYGPNERADEKWCLGGSHRKDVFVDQGRHE